tara:strand:+ start:175 stop:513 length:339 start_codon:yes stop_codon:yes gene_type:complete
VNGRTAPTTDKAEDDQLALDRVNIGKGLMYISYIAQDIAAVPTSPVPVDVIFADFKTTPLAIATTAGRWNVSPAMGTDINLDNAPLATLTVIIPTGIRDTPAAWNVLTILLF